jgi:hypothetical protein
MIQVRLKIGDGEIYDTYTKWGLIYMDADERTEAPIKTRAVSTYAHEAGEHIDRRTLQDAFDYTAKFLIETPNNNLENANAKIAAFNAALYTQDSGSDIRKYKQITFYNDYNRVKIVGIPEPIAQPTDFARRQDGSILDCAEVELKIRVEKPQLCDFSTVTDELSIALSVTSKGTLQVKLSRALNSDEHLCLLTKGKTRHRDYDGNYYTKGGWHHQNWRNIHRFGIVEFNTTVLDNTVYGVVDNLHRLDWRTDSTKKYSVVKIRKAANSTFVLPLEDGVSGRVTFAVAVYRLGGYTGTRKMRTEPVRISNIAYFRRNMLVEGDELTQWFSV